MSSLFLLISTLFLVHVYCQSIDTWSITTHADTDISSTDTLTMTLDWNNERYICSIVPNTASNQYDCDGTTTFDSAITADSYVPYFVKLEYDSTATVLIESFMVTVNSTSYELSDFCFSVPLSNTMDMSADMAATDAMSNCTTWDKHKYGAVALNSDEIKLTLLYLDFPNSVLEYPDQSMNGGVRPPALTSFGVDTAATGSVGIRVTVAWDIYRYQCSPIDMSTGYTTYDMINSNWTCEEELKCPGATSDNFFGLEQIDDTGSDQMWYDYLYVIDSTGNEYYATEPCLENVALTESSQNGVECIDSGLDGYYRSVDGVCVGYFLVNNICQPIHGLIWPNDTFQHANNVSYIVDNQVVDADLHGLENFYSPDPWVCPDTSDPTPAPTSAPTDVPSQPPTLSPSNFPSRVPSGSPSQPPTNAPVQPPTGSPSQPPTGSPSQPPTATPSQPPSGSPSQPPTGTPSQPPSGSPSQPPTRAPSQPPSYSPSRVPSGSPSQPPTGSPSQPPTLAPSQPPTKVPSGSPSQPPSDAPSDAPVQPPTAAPSSPTSEPTKSPITTDAPSPAPSTGPIESGSPTKKPKKEKKTIVENELFLGLMAAILFLICCILIWLLACLRKRKKEEKESDNMAMALETAGSPSPKSADSPKAVQMATYKKRESYKDYHAGLINTQPSMHADDDDAAAAGDDDIEIQYGSDVELEKAGAGAGEGDAVAKKATSQYSMGDGYVDTGDDAALDLILDGAKKHNPQESIGYTV